MIRFRTFGALLALGALTALPACSMFDGGKSSGQYSQGGSNAAGSYNTASNAAVAGDSGTVAPVSPDMIRQVQGRLRQDGSYKGQVDGVWGPMTGRAVRDWQQAHNLSTSGEIDMATLQSMDLSASGSQSGQANNPNGNADTRRALGDNTNYSTNGNYGTRSNNAATQPSGSPYSPPNSSNPNAGPNSIPPANTGGTMGSATGTGR
jgi:peptidoglycan hydrolase-like protein with peptidoglycan-binding domain